MTTIENPVTKKPITVGGAVYKKLLHEGINPHTGRKIAVGGTLYKELLAGKVAPKRSFLMISSNFVNSTLMAS